MDFHALQAAHLPPCTYCGDPATTKDHVPPRCYRSTNTRTVPACSMCNSKILRGSLLLTVKERQEYVSRFLKTSMKAFAVAYRRSRATAA